MFSTTSLAKAIQDPKRLAALRATALLDSPPEEAFDRFTRMAGNILKSPVALISLVDKDRQFFKSQYGLAEPLATRRETPLSHSFCKHMVETATPLVVADARDHPLLQDNPAIKDSQVIAYLGVPLQTAEGETLGSLCAIDTRPHVWSESDVQIVRDLGVWVMTEIELRLLAREFLKNYMDLRDSELQRDELTHMIVHDLRNPLTSLMLGLEVLQSNATLAAPIREQLGLAVQSAESLLTMIGDILDVNKAEAGKLNLELSLSSPRDIIESAYAQTVQMANRAGVTVEVKLADDLPLISADAEKLRRVLVNLISNAVQHTAKKGKVIISASRKKTGRMLVFEVSDTGLGIAHDDVGRIFEKYGKLNSRKVGRLSSGLGLPFCKLAVEAHGGLISVSSELGKGTIFRAEIPCETPLQ